MYSIDLEGLTLEELNKLIDRGERFYVTRPQPEIYDDSLWTTNDAFWCGGEPLPSGQPARE